MARPELLFLTQRIPYPPIKGEKIRPLQILRHLRLLHRR
jgi:polysaccharide biosynthesis protein PslH